MQGVEDFLRLDMTAAGGAGVAGYVDDICCIWLVTVADLSRDALRPYWGRLDTMVVEVTTGGDGGRVSSV